MLTPEEYARHDATALADLVRHRAVRAEELLEVAVAGVEALNPRLNAVVHRMHDEARARIRAGLPDGPFTGVPFMLKDLQALYAGHPITFGSRFFKDLVPDHDAEIVARHRRAGLVIMGKTNTPELGLSAATEPVLHSPCRNPWNLERSPGGSSGGSAAAVAAGILPMAHATDGGGSIRIPASACGLFGLKPTRGRNPMGPDVGEGWAGLATGHVVSRSVRDSARIMDATCGPAPGDPYHAPAPGRPYAQEVGADPGRLRIAFSTRTLGGVPAHPECVAAVEAAARLAANLGHHVEETAPRVDFAAALAAMRTIVAGSVQMTLAQRAQALGRPVREGDVERVTWQAAAEGRARTAADYAQAVLGIHQLGRAMGRFFQHHDLFMTPTLASPPIPLGTLDMNGTDFEPFYEKLTAFIPFTPPFNMTGMPAASLPLHWTPDGLPVGVQIGADFGNEALLFRVAAQFETACPWSARRPPVHITA